MSKQIDRTLELITDVTIHQFARIVVEEYSTPARRPKTRGSRKSPPALLPLDIRRANTMAYYAGRLCRAYNVAGMERDAVLAACILSSISNPLLDSNTVRMKGLSLIGTTPAVDIISDCVKALLSTEIEKTFPQGYSRPEVVAILASVLADERIIHLQHCEDQATLTAWTYSSAA